MVIATDLDNQKRYLESLVKTGGANGAWASSQLKNFASNYTAAPKPTSNTPSAVPSQSASQPSGGGTRPSSTAPVRQDVYGWDGKTMTPYLDKNGMLIDRNSSYQVANGQDISKQWGVLGSNVVDVNPTSRSYGEIYQGGYGTGSFVNPAAATLPSADQAQQKSFALRKTLEDAGYQVNYSNGQISYKAPDGRVGSIDAGSVFNDGGTSYISPEKLSEILTGQAANVGSDGRYNVGSPSAGYGGPKAFNFKQALADSMDAQMPELKLRLKAMQDQIFNNTEARGLFDSGIRNQLESEAANQLTAALQSSSYDDAMQLYSQYQQQLQQQQQAEQWAKTYALQQQQLQQGQDQFGQEMQFKKDSLAQEKDLSLAQIKAATARATGGSGGKATGNSADLITQLTDAMDGATTAEEFQMAKTELINRINAQIVGGGIDPSKGQALISMINGYKKTFKDPNGGWEGIVSPGTGTVDWSKMPTFGADWSGINSPLFNSPAGQAFNNLGGFVNGGLDSLWKMLTGK